MKRRQYGGYPTWKCRRCGLVFMEKGKRYVVDVPNHTCMSRLVLYDGERWHYMMQQKPHMCEDYGIGLADFIGLSPIQRKV